MLNLYTLSWILSDLNPNTYHDDGIVITFLMLKREVQIYKINHKLISAEKMKFFSAMQLPFTTFN